MAARIPLQPGALGLAVLWPLGFALSLVAAGDGVVPGDVRLARWIQELDGPAAEAIAAFGNLAGDYRTGLALTVPLLVLLGRVRRWRPVVLLVAVFVVRALNNILKAWIDSPRPTPDLVRVTEDAHGLGFPSGHAMGSTLLFGALAFLAWRELPPGRLRAAGVIASLAMIPIVGFGRVQTGAHWPSDVLGGYLLGAAVLVTLVIALALHRRPAGGSGRRGSGRPQPVVAVDGRRVRAAWERAQNRAARPE